MNRHGSMNRIYRLVWSDVRRVWVPVAENAKGRGKSGRSRSRRRSCIATALAVLAAAVAHAAPGGGNVVAGAGTISQTGNTTNIHQASQNLSINWQSFDVASQETVNFLQPSASAIAVNRILGGNGSQILGQLHANGQVFLINPNGIVFGKGSQVNVGGLVASTLDLNAAGFVGSAKSFSGAGAGGGDSAGGGSNAGSVTNQGTIVAAPGGYVALLGNRVSNQGLISARLGTVALGAGTAMTLTFNGNSLIHLQVDRSVLQSAAANGGLLRADGGQVVLTAGAKDALVASVVNNTGVVEARTVENHGGTITLLGGGAAGTVQASGTLDASAPEGGDGGHIETSAARVSIADGARVTTAAARGLVGSWLVDPQDFTVAASGGDISGATLSADLESTSITLQSSNGHAAGGGNVNVDAPVTWNANTALTLTASNTININASVSALGAAAGVILKPNTANGAEAASGVGVLTLGAGAAINLPNVSPTATTALVIGGTPYTVINSLGAAGSMTGTDLQGIGGSLAGHFALGSNLDASATSTWNGGAGFAPIGSVDTPFLGMLNGLGHVVGNLTINRPSTDGVGLFSYMGIGASLRDVGLTGGTVTGAQTVGALLGTNYGGTISNSYATGRVTGTSTVGGLVGVNYSGTIDRSHTTGLVTGDTNVGGLVGVNGGGAVYDPGGIGTISNSFSSAALNAASTVGGLAGMNYGSIAHSYATANVSGAGNVGGLVGFNQGTYRTIGVIDASYATGAVSGGGSAGGATGGGGVAGGNVGGLVGANGGTYGGQVTNSYATGNVRGVSSVGGLIGSAGIGTSSYGTVGFVSNSHATGSVTGTSAVGGLIGLNASTVTGSHATGSVSGSTEVGGLVGSNGGSWYGNYRTAGTIGTVGASFATGAVTGTTNVGGLVGLNGGASGSYGILGSISGSHATGSVHGTGNNVGGLVGYSYGTVADSYATGNVAGASRVGGLVGYSTPPFDPANQAFFNIDRSHATGAVTGTDDVGGLVGLATSSPISASYATGNVTASGSNVGGLVGSANYACCNDSLSPVSNSYATGNVSGVSNVGGLIGMKGFIGYNLSVNNTYATGSVSGTTNVGGLVGLSAYNGTADASILNSYAAGRVSGTTHVGGLVGYDDGSVGNSFWDTTTSGQATSAGGVGMTTAQMQHSTNFTAATGANGNVNPGWDLPGTWVIYDGHTDPLLASFMTPLTVTPNSGSVTYNGAAYGGALGVRYSVTPTGHVFGTLGFNGPAGAVNVGSYVLQPGGLYSDQQGYLISYGTGTLTVKQLASVAWAGGASGNWSNAANWAGGALPDYANVAAVTIPVGVTVTYDAGVPGATHLASVSSSGKLIMASGLLSTTGNLSTRGFDQTGGALNVGGTFAVNTAAGNVVLGNLTAGTLNITSRAGAVSQLASTAVVVNGTSSILADNGAAGAVAKTFDITLANAANNFVGTVTTSGANLRLNDSSGGLILGNTLASGSLFAVSRGGSLVETAGSAIDVGVTATLSADNGLSGASEVRYGITVGNAGNDFGTSLTLTGSNIVVKDGSGGVVLGNTLASGNLDVVSRRGAITQQAGTALNITGTTRLTADNGGIGIHDARYLIMALNSANRFGGGVTATANSIFLRSASALIATLDGTGSAELSAAGALEVSGRVATNLTTVSSGAGSTTLFGTTSVGNNLNVTSTGAVAALTPSTAVTVHGAGTRTPNSHVTVNHVVGALID